MSDAHSDKKPDVLGVLGGMGPAATLDFLEKLLNLTDAERDQEQIVTLTYNNGRIPDRNVAYLEDGPSPVSELIRSIKVLERGGADLIAIPCNTAHIWYNEIQKATELEILDVPLITSSAIPDGSKVGIISTTPVKKSGLYSKLLEDRGIEVRYADDQESVMKAIYHVKAGRLKEARSEFLKQIDLLESRGVDHILTGCTEVPVVIKKDDIGARMIDPMEILAVECVKRFGKEIRH